MERYQIVTVATTTYPGREDRRVIAVPLGLRHCGRTRAQRIAALPIEDRLRVAERAMEQRRRNETWTVEEILAREG